MSKLGGAAVAPTLSVLKALLSLVALGLTMQTASAQLLVAEEASGPASFATEMSANVDTTGYSRTNAEGGFGLGLSARQYGYFNRYVGVFVGADLSSKPISLNSSSRIGWAEVPAGFSLRVPFGQMENVFNLGAFYGVPLDNFDDRNGMVELQDGFGAMASFSSLAPVTEAFRLGIGADARTTFRSPFPVAGSARRVSLSFGLVGRLSY